jgi:A/G-specific adenine glycosylase
VNNQDFVNQLINWYHQNKRDLPWRRTVDPYCIWLSEIILQQTRVAQGLPYYLKFVEAFPTVFDLAKASESSVLRLWQGLGYYSRARNLHTCAKTIVNDYNGIFPNTYQGLLSLKGIGKYTAAAISSICHGEAKAVVDGNVYRVLSRVYGIDDDISSTSGVKRFEKLANDIIDNKRPSDYNQAIMEFGALQCVPKNPDCSKCPLLLECYAFKNNQQQQLPVKLKKVKVKKRYFNYFVIRANQKIYLNPRGPKDVWQGLYDFGLIESKSSVSIEEIMDSLPKEFVSEITIEEESKIFKHVLTHQRIFATFYTLTIANEAVISKVELFKTLKPYNVKEIKELPKPILINNFLEASIF